MISTTRWTLDKTMLEINESGICGAEICDIASIGSKTPIAFSAIGNDVVVLCIFNPNVEEKAKKITLSISITKDVVTVRRLIAPKGAIKQWKVKYTDHLDDLFAKFIDPKKKKKHVMIMEPELFDEFVKWADLRGCALDKIAS